MTTASGDVRWRAQMVGSASFLELLGALRKASSSSRSARWTFFHGVEDRWETNPSAVHHAQACRSSPPHKIIINALGPGSMKLVSANTCVRRMATAARAGDQA